VKQTSHAALTLPNNAADAKPAGFLFGVAERPDVELLGRIVPIHQHDVGLFDALAQSSRCNMAATWSQ
jgi:hypothetical protein